MQLRPTMMLAFQRRISVTSSFREIFAAAALALLAPMYAEAQPQTYESSQVNMLPVYCKYTQVFRERVPGGNNRAEIERWTTSMGSVFNHMHHYCWGLMASNRAAFLSNNREDRMRNLNGTLGEFEYVIQRAPPDFPLLPEILTRKGESLIQLDRAGEGMLELQRAIKIKADYAPAYAAMSDYYKETGQLAKARESLEKGLSAAPNAKALMRRLAALDAAKGKRKND
jgi:tetratricopeptide (TPR) repeat protein